MISFTVTLAALCVSSSAAFSTLPSLVRSRSALNAFAVATEDDAIYLMHRAQECAFSDSCSVEEAEGYLHDVLHVQSGCAAGTLSSHAVCEEQDVVAEIVANLRAKVNGSRTYVLCPFPYHIASQTTFLSHLFLFYLIQCGATGFE